MSSSLTRERVVGVNIVKIASTAKFQTWQLLQKRNGINENLLVKILKWYVDIYVVDVEHFLAEQRPAFNTIHHLENDSFIKLRRAALAF